RFPALQVFEIINGLGQSANLHSGTIPTSNQRNFALCFKFSELPRRLPQIDVSENISGLAIKLTIN
ncbi:hypothetical protein FQI62_27365, partial [Escherichia coli]|nr:hypothetical protein [Escherichia coli]